MIKQFYDSSGGYGVAVARETAWRGRFVRAGINGARRNGPWSLQAGDGLHSVWRDAADAILAARGIGARLRGQRGQRGRTAALPHCRTATRPHSHTATQPQGQHPAAMIQLAP